MKGLRFLFVSNFYPPHDIGGYEKHCQEVTEALRQRGHNIHVLTSQYGLGAPVQQGHVSRLLFLESNLQYYAPLRFFIDRKREEQFNINALNATIANHVPDAILFWGMWNMSRRLSAFAESSDIPVAYWLEDFWPLDPDMHTQYWRASTNGRVGRLPMSWISRRALSMLAAENYPPAMQFRYVGCGSEFLKNRLASEIAAFRDATVVLCGIDLGMFRDCRPHERMSEPAAPRIIYIGGVGPHKGVHTAVMAVARLIDQAPELQPTLTIVGAGHPDYTARLQELADRAGITKHICFIGSVANNAVPSLLAKHDVLVVPSVWEEPFGRVVVEGMAAGLVVVGTATGGSAEILVDGVNGLVFPVEDVDALANQLLRLIHDPDLYNQLSQKGKKNSERFDLIHMVDGIERFLFEVVASNQSRSLV